MTPQNLDQTGKILPRRSQSPQHAPSSRRVVFFSSAVSFFQHYKGREGTRLDSWRMRCKSARLLLMGLYSATYPDANFYKGASHIRFRASLSHFSSVISVRCHFQAAIFFSSSFHKIRTISDETDKREKCLGTDRGKRKKIGNPEIMQVI